MGPAVDAMPTSKPDSKKDRRKKALAERAQHDQALKELVQNAERDQEPLRHFPAFCTFNRNGLEARIQAQSVGQMSAQIAEWALDLCRTNMQQMYEGVWGWSDKKKRRQLTHVSSRFLIAFDKPDSPEGGDGASSSEEGQPLAYVNYRFELEDGEPVAYCYEVHLEERAQRRGLGKHMMQLLELVAVKYGMQCVMLTVMRSNTAAVGFYSRLGYKEHESSPGMVDPDERAGYQILFKTLPRPRRPAAAGAGAAPAAAMAAAGAAAKAAADAGAP